MRANTKRNIVNKFNIHVQYLWSKSQLEGGRPVGYYYFFFHVCVWGVELGTAKDTSLSGRGGGHCSVSPASFLIFWVTLLSANTAIVETWTTSKAGHSKFWSCLSPAWLKLYSHSNQEYTVHVTQWSFWLHVRILVHVAPKNFANSTSTYIFNWSTLNSLHMR